jgi:hypothetical protein
MHYKHISSRKFIFPNYQQASNYISQQQYQSNATWVTINDYNLQSSGMLSFSPKYDFFHQEVALRYRQSMQLYHHLKSSVEIVSMLTFKRRYKEQVILMSLIFGGMNGVIRGLKLRLGFVSLVMLHISLENTEIILDELGFIRYTS